MLKDVTPQPATLVTFKKIVHGYYTAYCMAGVGMKDTAEGLQALPDFNIDGRFQIGAKSTARKAISDIPTKFAVQGMTKDGPFSQMIAHGLIVLIYTMWEDQYRGEIATELGVNTNWIMCDVMGEVRHLRNWFAHRVENTKAELDKLHIFKWPRQGKEVLVTSREMAQLIEQINIMQVQIKER